MRPSNKQRSRNKQGNGGHNNNNNNNNNNQRQRMGNIINRVFESAGPDGKVRGTPQQIIDKYQALARDAQVAGDRVAAESFLQHSEHYSRLLGEAQRHQLEQREREEGNRQDRPQSQDPAFRPQSPAPQQGGFGFGAIDADDDPSTGLIETPEGRAEQVIRAAEPVADIPSRAAELESLPDPAPVAAPEAAWQPVVELPEPAAAPVVVQDQVEPVSPVADAAGTDAPAEEPAAAPRPRRPRRRKTEAAAPAAAGEAAAVAE